jgi:quinol monooxygenase YgiN
VVLVHLAAYGEADRADTFEVLRLRNPARRNFYLREDLERLLRAGGAAEVTLEDARVVEDVEAWADNRAIDDHRVRAVSDAYRAANEAFLRSHEVRFVDGRILDTMLMVIATGVRASGS